MERLTALINGRWCLQNSDDRTGALWPDSLLQKGIDRLAAYEDAEEQGRLVWLPCKRGDKVWRICGQKKRKFVAERTVLSVTMYEPGEFEIFTNCLDWLGKTVFLTREEAEDALKEANRNG